MTKNNILSPNHKLFIKKLKLRSAFVIGCQIGILICFLGIWELFAYLEIIDSFILSSPSRILKTLISMNNGEILNHIWVSTKETIIGFLLGTFIGTVAAILLWWSKTLHRILEPYIIVLNSLPKIALGPIIIIWVGTGQIAIITMAILISVVLTTINMLNGFNETNTNKILLMRTMHSSKLQIFTKLVFPANITTLVSTLKINVGMAWVGTIIGEYLVSKEGLGYLIVYGGQVFNLDLVMTCILILCIVAGLMYMIVAFFEKLLIRWQN